ncbi:MAG: hypothetical protein ACLFTR_03425 [Candidatus Woesearchaeota archaeon]
MYDTDILDNCHGLMCLIESANEFTDGWLAIGILIMVWFISFVTRLTFKPEEYIDAMIIANFAIVVVAYLLFLGELLRGEIVIVPILLLGATLILRKILG